MTSDRRYSDDEVAEILDRATEAHAVERTASPASSDGLTLAELHDIGAEVGISKDLITRAATGLERTAPDPVASRKFLGQTIGVGRTVYLPRPLTDDEWNRLVVDLRETFDAKGKMKDEGAFRQWTNSNLQALLEPTESGERLRLRTYKGNAMTFQGMGMMFMAMPPFVFLLNMLRGTTVDANVLIMALIGFVFFLGSRVSMPTWARTREDQMEGVIERLTAGLETDSD